VVKSLTYQPISRGGFRANFEHYNMFYSRDVIKNGDMPPILRLDRKRDESE